MFIVDAGVDRPVGAGRKPVPSGPFEKAKYGGRRRSTDKWNRKMRRSIHGDRGSRGSRGSTVFTGRSPNKSTSTQLNSSNSEDRQAMPDRPRSRRVSVQGDESEESHTGMPLSASSGELGKVVVKKQPFRDIQRIARRTGSTLSESTSMILDAGSIGRSAREIHRVSTKEPAAGKLIKGEEVENEHLLSPKNAHFMISQNMLLIDMLSANLEKTRLEDNWDVMSDLVERVLKRSQADKVEDVNRDLVISALSAESTEDGQDRRSMSMEGAPRELLLTICRKVRSQASTNNRAAFNTSPVTPTVGKSALRVAILNEIIRMFGAHEEQNPFSSPEAGNVAGKLGDRQVDCPPSFGRVSMRRADTDVASGARPMMSGFGAEVVTSGSMRDSRNSDAKFYSPRTACFDSSMSAAVSRMAEVDQIREGSPSDVRPMGPGDMLADMGAPSSTISPMGPLNLLAEVNQLEMHPSDLPPMWPTDRPSPFMAGVPEGRRTTDVYADEYRDETYDSGAKDRGGRFGWGKVLKMKEDLSSQIANLGGGKRRSERQREAGGIFRFAGKGRPSKEYVGDNLSPMGAADRASLVGDFREAKRMDIKNSPALRGRDDPRELEELPTIRELEELPLINTDGMPERLRELDELANHELERLEKEAEAAQELQEAGEEPSHQEASGEHSHQETRESQTSQEAEAPQTLETSQTSQPAQQETEATDENATPSVCARKLDPAAEREVFMSSFRKQMELIDMLDSLATEEEVEQPFVTKHQSSSPGNVTKRPFAALRRLQMAQ